MTSAVPPRLATWMLAHLMLGDRDEALAGDLLESYCAGRSAGWYWRQTLTACLLSWGLALQTRLPLLFFALTWSLLAPAWQLLCEHVTNSQIAASVTNIFGGIWVIPALIGWTIMHAAFVWGGALIYSAAHGTLGTPLRGENIRRGLLVAPIVLDVVYAATFVLVNLYYYSIPSLAGQQLAATAMGRVVDIRLLPDLMRFPYFIALVSTLWGAIEAAPRFPDKLKLSDDLVQQPHSATHFVFLLVAAGTMNALLFGYLLCKLPTVHAVSLTSLLIRATASVGIGVLGGVAGTWLYWKSPWSLYREETPFSLRLFVLVCAPAWAWAPASALYSEQLSAAMAIVATVGSYLLFVGLRDAAPRLLPDLQIAQSRPVRERSLFADAIASPNFEFHGYLIAVALYAGCAAIFWRANYAAALLLALCAAIFAWQKPAPGNDLTDEQGPAFKRFAFRFAVALLAAVLATAWALLDEVSRSGQIDSTGTNAAASAKNHPGNTGRASASAKASFRGVGYESLILFSRPEKQTIIAPTPSRVSLLAPGRTTPVTLRFAGSYRYVQPPNKHPGPHAHHAYGTPMDADIESNNSIPLIMDAHQNLAAPIQTDRCKTIQVDVANFDNIAGRISLALLLIDDSSGRARTLHLGQQPIVSTDASHFAFKSRPVFETLSFSIPSQTSLQEFDQITVVVLPDVEHFLIAPKIAIESFRLFPR